MLDQLPPLRGRTRSRPAEEPGATAEFAPLRFLAVEMLLLTGIGATLELLSRRRSARDADGAERGLPLAAVWAPSLLAPLAAAAHLRQMLRPSPATRTASHFLNGAVVGLGLAEAAGTLLPRARGDRAAPLLPLALASSGALGLALEAEETAVTEERRRLEQRARIVERLVPRRRPKLDRVVVHL